jgi:hypothetical protein
MKEVNIGMEWRGSHAEWAVLSPEQQAEIRERNQVAARKQYDEWRASLPGRPGGVPSYRTVGEWYLK